MDVQIQDLINDPSVAPEPQQVQDIEVVFVPFVDFEGRVNQTNYAYRKGVPARMPRDLANFWLESSKGYIRE